MSWIWMDYWDARQLAEILKFLAEAAAVWLP